ncbi:MAG: DUF1801 domain-containing protein [Acidimicrobiia bacterium]
MANDVDEWFAGKEHPQEPAMQQVRKVIMATDPRVTETIKWSTPTFMYEGNIASFNPAKNFVSLLFHRGAEIPGDHPRLEGEGKLARTMRFADVGDVEEGADDLRSVVRSWIEMKGG